MNYPADVFFDIETLITVAQPQRILLVGEVQAGFLDDYVKQKELLNQLCTICVVDTGNVASLWELDERFDVSIGVNLFEHLDKQTGMRVLSRLRDVLSPQYCVCLPIKSADTEAEWQLTDLFSFALNKVSTYSTQTATYGLFKYNITDYKKTPDWLNADNWANPQMWGKYWW